MSTPEGGAGLFAGMAVDYGTPRPNLTRARALVEGVEAMASEMDEFVEKGLRLVTEARRLGAHSVARAVRWLLEPDTLGRHGYDAMHIRAERIAHGWLRRHERWLAYGKSRDLTPNSEVEPEKP